MIKAIAKGRNEDVLIAGLAEENVVRLRNYQPIIVDLAEMELTRTPTQLMICYGRTEKDIEAYFRRKDLIAPDTVIHESECLNAHLDIKANESKVLILTVGLPRSGKSTWARTQGYPIVCPDEIRTAIHGHRFIAEAEPFVWATCKVMVRALFGAGHQFVILDATNTTRKRRDEWKSTEWASRFKYFDTSESVCRSRAEAEDDRELWPIISRMAEQFEPLQDDELYFS